MSADKPSETVIEAACAPLMDNDHVRNFVYSEWDDGAEVGALAEKILTHIWPIVVREVRLAGWVPFGTHVDCLDLQLEFSALGEDGLPEWERVAFVAAGLVGEPAAPQATLDGVGVGEAAEILGVSKQRTHQLTHTDGFPEPVLRLRATPVWQRSDIEEFARTRSTRPGPVPRDSLAAEVGEPEQPACEHGYTGEHVWTEDLQDVTAKRLCRGPAAETPDEQR